MTGGVAIGRQPIVFLGVGRMVAWILRCPPLYGSGAVLLICPRCAFVLRGTQDEVGGRNLLAVFF
jgi:hypothetical protein